MREVSLYRDKNSQARSRERWEDVSLVTTGRIQWQRCSEWDSLLFTNIIIIRSPLYTQHVIAEKQRKFSSLQ